MEKKKIEILDYIFNENITLNLKIAHFIYKHTLQILLILWRICASYEISGLKSIW